MKRASLLALAALVLASLAGGATDAPGQSPVAKLNAKHRKALILTTPAYRLVLSKDNGGLIELVDRRTGTRLLRGQAGCAWGLTFANGDGLGACSFSRTAEDRFTYRWTPAASRLTLRYRKAEDAVTATVTVTARPEHVDLALTLEHALDRPVATVHFPADLVGDVASTTGLYTPTFLPGLRLLPSFFSAPRKNVERYPSRWAFADFVAADVGRSHLAVYGVNPAPSPIAPVDVGVLHNGHPAPCSGETYCLTHAFQTWLVSRSAWSSPTIRLRVGGTAERSILAYRDENGIDDYPSLASKVGARLDTLARAPLVKADLWKGLPSFGDWAPTLRRLPSPSLLHPVAFQPRGHDEDYPDFLPPDPRWGTTADFNGALTVARAAGHIVMPYLNVSWWDTQAPSVRALAPPMTATDIAMQTPGGVAVTEQFGPRDGYIVSPYVPYVRERVTRLFEEWRTEVPVECMFFDQIGARPWRRDFNPAAPTPLAYYDGWLETFATHRERCLMAEDGWDRLADAFSGFHGGLLQMQREHRWADARFGEGNWEPYPIALWLLHDKVLLYQHDLYEGSFTDDPEALLHNVAFGNVLSYTWDGGTRSLESPWLDWVGSLQRTLGPHYVGRPLTSFERLAPDVTETRFGEYSVVANWSATAPYDHDGHRLAPLGFVARDGDRVLAGAFGDSWTHVTIAPPG